jgi:hypothetical protein
MNEIPIELLRKQRDLIDEVIAEAEKQETVNAENDRIENMIQQLAKVGAVDIKITKADGDGIHSIRFTLNGVSMRAQCNEGETCIYGIEINTYNGVKDLAQLIGGAK